MKKLIALGVAIVLATVVSARAEDLTSGPQVGEKVGAFEVTKAAGAVNDGVPAGMNLCYRCKLGQAPVVTQYLHAVFLLQIVRPPAEPTKL